MNIGGGIAMSCGGCMYVCGEHGAANSGRGWM
jgi:hypothetical protein